MKRTIAEREIDHMTMANCLMLLSRGGEMDAFADNSPSRVFECKTCNRKFQSFQALGGHRASHKKPRLMMGGADGGNLDQSQSHGSSPTKPKTHECSICGLEFAIGQALGGHMRRHRTALTHHENQAPFNLTQSLLQVPDLGASSSSSSSSSQVVPVVKKTTSRRVLFLDLNLTPVENNLECVRLGKAAPLIDCFL